MDYIKELKKILQDTKEVSEELGLNVVHDTLYSRAVDILLVFVQEEGKDKRTPKINTNEDKQQFNKQSLKPTEQQINTLKKMGVKDEIILNLNKKSASNMISEMIELRKVRK